MIAQININSIRNKFETIVSLVTSDLDILIISEKKLMNLLHFHISQWDFSVFQKYYCKIFKT